MRCEAHDVHEVRTRGTSTSYGNGRRTRGARATARLVSRLCAHEVHDVTSYAARATRRQRMRDKDERCTVRAFLSSLVSVRDVPDGNACRLCRVGCGARLRRGAYVARVPLVSRLMCRSSLVRADTCLAAVRLAHGRHESTHTRYRRQRLPVTSPYDLFSRNFASDGGRHHIGR